MVAIQTAVRTIPGVRARVDVFIPDQVNPPQAVVYMPTVLAYHSAFNRGLMHLQVELEVIVSKTVDRADQIALTTYADATGANSIIGAIESDKTLGGVVSDCMVVDYKPNPTETVGELGYYGGRFTLQVYAAGK
jgi:hypothetical protein